MRVTAARTAPAPAPAPPPVPATEPAMLPFSAHAAATGRRAAVGHLLELARATPSQLHWHRDLHISQAHNAHFTNTPAQMERALRGPYNSLEGDVRMESGEPVMAHDSGAGGGLLFADWARIAAASGRMVRIDIKEIDALPLVLRIVDQLGIPDHRLTINVSVYSPLLASNATIGMLRAIRARRPGAYIGLNVPYTLHGFVSYRALIRAARAVGHPVMVALEASHVTPAAVRMLRRHMIVGAWNDPRRAAPSDIAAETARLRALGIDGMIDLRAPGDPFDRP